MVRLTPASAEQRFDERRNASGEQLGLEAAARKALLRWADGLPAATELAATASRWLSAQQLARRFAHAPDQLLDIDDAGARLRAQAQASLAQLTTEARAALALCCTFEDGFEVSRLDLDLSCIERLRQLGWLSRSPQRGPAQPLRWQVAEPLRVLALHLLNETERLQARRAHAELVLAAVERGSAAMPENERRSWQGQLETVIAHMHEQRPTLAQRAAVVLMRWSRFDVSETGAPKSALHVLAAAHQARSPEPQAGSPDETAELSRTAQLELAVAVRHIDIGAFDNALIWLRKASCSAQTAPDRILAQVYRGHIWTWQGEYERARTALDQAALLHQGERDTIEHYGHVLAQRAFLAMRSRSAQTTAALDEASRYAELHGLSRMRAICDNLRGRDRLLAAGSDRPTLEAAQSWLERAGQVFAEQGDQRALLFNRAFIAAVLRRRGQADRAHRLALTAYRKASALRSEALELQLLIELHLCGHTERDGLARAHTLSERTQVRALRDWADLALNGHQLPALLVGAGTMQVTLDGTTIDLSRREAPRRILSALCCRELDAAGGAASAHRLFRAGWPDQRIHVRSQLKRVQTAVWTLRSMGLASVIESTAEGYRLRARVRWQPQGYHDNGPSSHSQRRRRPRAKAPRSTFERL